MRTVIAVCLICAGEASLFPASASAEALQQSLAVTTGADYDSNPRMMSGSHPSVFRYRVAPQYTGIYSQDVDALTFSAGILFERSNDQKASLDRNDPNARLTWRRMLENGDFSVNAGASKVSARTTELANNGLVAADTTQTNKSVGAAWQYNLAERLGFALTGDYRSVTSDKANTGLIDYSTTAVGLSVNYDLDEASQVFTNVNASHYEPDSALIHPSNTYGAVLGYKRKFSEEFGWSVQAGPVRVTGSNSVSTWQGGTQINFSGEKIEASLDANRSVLPSTVTGGFTNSDQLRALVSYPLDEKTRAGADLSWIKSKATIATTTQIYGVYVAREFSPFWSLTLRYQNRQVDHTTGLASASANILSLTLNYSLPDF